MYSDLLKLLEGETIFGVNWIFIISLISAIAFVYKKIYVPWRSTEIQKYEEQKQKDQMLKNSLDQIQKLQKEHQHDNERNNALFAELKNELDQISREMKETKKNVYDLTEQNRKSKVSDKREKILQAHRYYTNENINPLKAWTEMEAYTFSEQVKDYESLGGNDYVHRVVKPDMEKLIIVPMDDVESISRLMSSRHQNGQ